MQAASFEFSVIPDQEMTGAHSSACLPLLSVATVTAIVRLSLRRY